MRKIKNNNKKVIVKLNTKNVIELILGRIMLSIILGIIATAILIGIIWLLGAIIKLAEMYVIAKIVLFVVGFMAIIKLVNDAE